MTNQLLPISFKDNKEAHRRLAQAINAVIVKSSSTGAVDGLDKTKGNLIAGSGTAWEAVAVGSNGKVLTADSTAADGISWDDPLAGFDNTKGNLLAASGSAWEAVAAGSDGQILTADSGEADGIKWVSPLVIGGMIMLSAASVGTGTQVTQALTGTVERIEVGFYGISHNNASAGCGMRLGTGGALATSGYVTAVDWSAGNTSATGAFSFTNTPQNQAVTWDGILQFVHLGNDVWVGSGHIYQSASNIVFSSSGTVTLTGPLDIIGIAAGAGNLDAGYWKISYQRSA